MPRLLIFVNRSPVDEYRLQPDETWEMDESLRVLRIHQHDGERTEMVAWFADVTSVIVTDRVREPVEA